MQIEKWYADAITPAARIAIYYRAKVSVGPIDISYRGQLDDRLGEINQLRRAATGATRSAFMSGPSAEQPRLQGPAGEQRIVLRTDTDTLCWRNAVSRPICLWSRGPHRVDWDPLVLNGAVEGGTIGRGYAEKLVMTIAPWQLGIKRLRWGRFCGNRHSLVWIVWQGRYPLSLCLLDGRLADQIDVTDDAVAAADARLRLGERRRLVDERLGAGALADLPWPRRVAPIAFLRGRERKWFATGELRLDGGGIDCGEVICESVEWT
jgi:hypothetical protein